jgi:hypothetical protein
MLQLNLSCLPVTASVHFYSGPSAMTDILWSTRSIGSDDGRRGEHGLKFDRMAKMSASRTHDDSATSLAWRNVSPARLRDTSPRFGNARPQLALLHCKL